jgi:hypothetical protein
MVSRTARPQPDLSRLILWSGLVLAIVALVLGLPGALLAVAGAFTAAFFTPPAMFTGKKDRAGRPTAAHQGEADSARRYRRMRDLRWRVVTPNADWLPGKDVRVSWVLGLLAGVALAAIGLPRVPPEWWWAPVVNGALAAIAIWQITGSGRRFASEYDPHPGIGIKALVRAKDLDKRMVPAAFASTAGALIIAAVGSWVVLSSGYVPAGAFGSASSVVAVGALTALAGLGTLTSFVRSLISAEWAELVATRLAWDQRWLNVGVKNDAPFLVEHRRVGPLSVDTFDAPASEGARTFTQESTTAKIVVALGANMRVWTKAEPNIDGQGQPVPGSVHPLRFSVVYVPGDQMPNVTDVNLDEAAAQLVIESAMGPACEQGRVSRYTLVAIEQVAKLGDAAPAPSDDEEGDDEPAEAGSPWRVWRTVWTNRDGLGGTYLRNAVKGYYEMQLSDGQAPVQVLVDHRGANGQGIVYIGYLTEDETVYDPASGVEKIDLVNIAREDAWRERWGAALKQDTNPPTPELSLFREEQLAGPRGRRGAVVRSQPFKTLQGVEPTSFFGLEDKLKATLAGAPFVAITGFPGRGERRGDRHSQAFCVYWSDQPVADGPHSLTPTTSEAAQWVLAGRINEAFKAARLERPEVAGARCLTKATSTGHIWKIDLRLYGGVTLAEVRAARERIRGALGSSWLRVAEAADGCTIYAGADPARVKLDREGDRALLVSLDWEQAWLVSKVTGEGGTLPRLTGVDQLPHNTKVQVLDFALPAGLSPSEVRAGIEKLKTATGNAFAEVQPGADGASSVRLLVCEVNPLPEKAPYNFEVIDSMVGKLVFATGVDGEPIAFNPKVDPHLLVAGASGGGKSVTLQSLIYGAIVNGWDLFIADPTKGAADFQFATPYAKAIAVDPISAAAMMRAIYTEVVRRKDLNAKNGVGNYRDLPDDVRPSHILLVIDEFTSLMGADPVPAASDDAEMDAEREAILATNRAKTEVGVFAGKIAREARSAGVTLVLATQKLAAKLLDTIPGAGDLKVNLSRMLLGKSTFGDKQSALRDPTNAPELGDAIPPGRGLWETTEGQAKIMQSWYDPREQAVLSQMLAERVADGRLRELEDAERLDLVAVVGAAKARSGGSGSKWSGPRVRTITAEEVELDEMVLTWADLDGLDLGGPEEVAEPEPQAVVPADDGEGDEPDDDDLDDEDADDDPDDENGDGWPTEVRDMMRELTEPGYETPVERIEPELAATFVPGPEPVVVVPPVAPVTSAPAPAPAPAAMLTGWELPPRPARTAPAAEHSAAVAFTAPDPEPVPTPDPQAFTAPTPAAGAASDVLLLDIDGVLSPLTPAPDALEIPGAGGTMRVNPRLARAVADLGVQVSWASNRSATETSDLTAAAGLPAAPGLDQTDGTGDLGWWKVEALAAWLTRHPEVRRVAFVDDELASEDIIGIPFRDIAADVLARAGVAHLLLSPDPGDGLSSDDLAVLASFFDVATPVLAAPAPHEQPEPQPVAAVAAAPVAAEPEPKAAKANRAAAFIPRGYEDDSF